MPRQIPLLPPGAGVLPQRDGIIGGAWRTTHSFDPATKLEAAPHPGTVTLFLRTLKRFAFQRDTAFQLALRSTMRRILATLAVAGALLFSAGSAWADFDDGWAAYESGDYATALQGFGH